MTILVTGGAGYIGSHTCVELLEAGYDAVDVDNLSNSDTKSIERVEKITGKPLPLYTSDLLDIDALNRIFEKHTIDTVIHFAGYKAVGESVAKPLKYYENNLVGTIRLLQCMKEHNVKNIVFSSSATVYGDPHKVPITEDFPIQATNPYGRSKLMIEEILRDLYKSDSSWNIAILRYFNPVGAHKSGLIGEDPNDIPNNLVPYISQVAIGKLKELRVFGNDYPTPDGTGVRDYIHVIDLALGHIKAVEKICQNPGLFTVNLGTGRGYSVLEMIKAFEKASGRKIPYIFTDRRPGDIAVCYADPTKAYELLGWKAERDIDEMCEDTWRWQTMNPNGYK
ncbi:MAG: UDP-glucose 4-epimerase GalE [Clostridiaceae bacterium]|nr:UDP-glucose 4-epimerase GalE [Clostridiaceae bacterium]